MPPILERLRSVVSDNPLTTLRDMVSNAIESLKDIGSGNLLRSIGLDAEAHCAIPYYRLSTLVLAGCVCLTGYLVWNRLYSIFIIPPSYAALIPLFAFSVLVARYRMTERIDVFSAKAEDPEKKRKSLLLELSIEAALLDAMMTFLLIPNISRNMWPLLVVITICNHVSMLYFLRPLTFPHNATDMKKLRFWFLYPRDGLKDFTPKQRGILMKRKQAASAKTPVDGSARTSQTTDANAVELDTIPDNV